MEGRRTRERPWKQTIPRRGVGESALKLRAVWEGDCREAKVRTGLGKSHGPGSQGGPRETWLWWKGDPTPQSKEREWKPSTYGASIVSGTILAGASGEGDI